VAESVGEGQEEIVFLLIAPSQEFCLIAFLVLFAGGEHSSGEVVGRGGAGSGVHQDVGPDGGQSATSVEATWP
jgi:hypothetical protein